MRIEQAVLYQVQLQLRQPFTTSFGTLQNQQTLLVKLVSEGLTGWGEAPLLPLPVYSHEFFAGGWTLLSQTLLPRILKMDWENPRQFQERLAFLKGNPISKAGVEMALWDLFSRKAGMPLYRYLGCTRSSQEVGVSIGLQGSVSALLDEIAAQCEEGYKRIKIKIKPGQDLELVASVRKRYPDLPLMVDANSAYTLSDLPLFKQLDDYRLMMIEQPLADGDIVDHATLQQALSTPLCLDESITTADDARKALALGSCKIINVKPPRVGGISETLRIGAIAAENNIPVWVGGMLESAVGKAFLDHTCMLNAFSLPGDNSPNSRYFVEDIARESHSFSSGIITLNDKPGIGLAPDEDLLAAHTLEKMIFRP